MSWDNVELVRSMWPGDVDMVAFLDAGMPFPAEAARVLDPDARIEFISNAPGVPSARYRGFEGFAEGWRDWLTPFDRYELSVEEAIDAGDDVLVLTHVRARTHRDGVVVEHDPGAVFAVRDGRIAAVRFYLERAAALEAAGVNSGG